MSDCVFCKIINGELPSYKVYEDDFSFAFLDLNNDGNGHILFVPKTHYENILDCDSKILSKVMESVQKISKHLVDNCGFDGVNILNASGRDAEQTVFHLHFHILPRKKDDGFTACAILPENTKSKEELIEIFKIKD